MADATRAAQGRTIETREVLEAAYVRRGLRPMLSHAVIVDRDRRAMQVLCRRVAFDNLADRNASDPHAPVTCRACLAAIKRLIAAHSPQEPRTAEEARTRLEDR